MTDHTAADDDDETAARAREVIRTLAATYRETCEAPNGLSVLAEKGPIFPVAFGWWAAITRTAEALVLLYDSGFGHESAPMVRNILQHTLVLQWLVETGQPALDAIDEYGSDNTRKLANTARQANWSLPPDVQARADALPPPPRTPNPLVKKYLKNFEALCVEYNARRLYVAYRLDSGYAHPTRQSAAAYHRDDAVREGILTWTSEAPHRQAVILPAVCLILTGLIISPMLEGDPLQPGLAAASRRLGAEITLSVRRAAAKQP